MSFVVWKFDITAAVESRKRQADIRMPKGARILSAEYQRKELCLWALVDDTAASERRRFVTQMTGETMEPEDAAEASFIRTLHLAHGSYVLHLFEDLRGAAQTEEDAP